MEIIKKYHRLLLTLGIVFQIFVSLVAYHPDLRAFVLAGKFIIGERFSPFTIMSPSSLQPIRSRKSMATISLSIHPSLILFRPASMLLSRVS